MRLVAPVWMQIPSLIRHPPTLPELIPSRFTPQGSTVRLSAPSPTPLASAVAVSADNGVDNDSNAIQPGGVGFVVTSPIITLTAGGEPGFRGSGNTENTIDLGLRACPTITITPTTLSDATRYSSYNQTLTATGGAAPYVWTVTNGTLPTGMSLTSGGVLSGTPTSVPGSSSFTVRPATAWDAQATRRSLLSCFAQRSRLHRRRCPLDYRIRCL